MSNHSPTIQERINDHLRLLNDHPELTDAEAGWLACMLGAGEAAAGSEVALVVSHELMHRAAEYLGLTLKRSHELTNLALEAIKKPKQSTKPSTNPKSDTVGLQDLLAGKIASARMGQKALSPEQEKMIDDTLQLKDLTKEEAHFIELMTCIRIAQGAEQARAKGETKGYDALVMLLAQGIRQYAQHLGLSRQRCEDLVRRYDATEEPFRDPTTH